MPDENSICDCNELPIIPDVGSPRDSIDIVGIGEIVVTNVITDGVKVFTIQRVVYAAPSISATANPVREVGASVNFSWSVNISQGSQPVTARQITPAGEDPGPSFSRSVTANTRTTRGVNTAFTITATDGVTPQTRVLSIAFVNRVRLLITYKDGVTAGQEITESDILGATSTLADNIKSVYGGVHAYVIPASAVNQYIYWIYEAGTTPISAVELNNLPFPLVFIPGSVLVTNPINNTISTPFTLVRSANKFGTGTLSLNMK